MSHTATNSDESSTNNFRLESMGVAMDFHSNISNIFKNFHNILSLIEKDSF